MGIVIHIERTAGILFITQEKGKNDIFPLLQGVKLFGTFKVKNFRTEEKNSVKGIKKEKEQRKSTMVTFPETQLRATQGYGAALLH